MAEFQKVMEQWRRFCKSHNHCGECELDGKGICGEAHLTDIPYADIELRIMAWAASHPEFVEDDMFEHIPEETAQLIGLKPLPIVNGDCGATNEADARKKLGIELKEG